MKQQILKVFEFMHKHGHDARVDVLSEMGAEELNAVTEIGRALEETGKQLIELELVNDPRVGRLQLIIEETGELADALASRDKLLVADAITDLLYVVIGTAIKFDIPLEACFNEVHRSNMTKDAGGHKPVKGEEYSEPDLLSVIAEASAP